MNAESSRLTCNIHHNLENVLSPIAAPFTVTKTDGYSKSLTGPIKEAWIVYLLLLTGTGERISQSLICAFEVATERFVQNINYFDSHLSLHYCLNIEIGKRL